MNRSDYPRTYQEADRVSAAKQKLYKRLTIVNLLSLAAAATLAILATVLPTISRGLVGLSAACVLAAVVIWLVLGVGRPDNEWFDARSVAESVKTMTWRYLMKANPYGQLISDEEAERLFLAETKQVLQQKQKVAAQLECPTGQKEITSFMRKFRAATIENRLSLYLEGRVGDQKTWYSNKAKQNRSAARLWFWTAFGLQIAGLVAATVNIVVGMSDLPGLFVTLAALVMAWQQVQQFTYLAHSYGSTAQDFAIIESKANGIDTESHLSTYVEQAELAASREHTLWVSRNAL